jgi:hypothetical protein
MRLRKETDPKSLTPQRFVWGAYLLSDDLVYRTVNKAASAIGKKTGLSKKALAYGSFICGASATTALLGSRPVHAAIVGLFSAMAIFPLRNLIEKASEFRASAGAVAEDEIRFVTNLLFRASRLPAFVFGALKFVEGLISQSSQSLAYGTYFLGVGITAYLVTSSTGMLDKAKESIQRLLEGITQSLPEPLPVPVRK